MARTATLQSPVLTTGLIAGLLGGMAEVVWITAYAGMSDSSAAQVAASVTATFSDTALALPVAVLLGVAIHFLLAAALGVAVVIGCREFLPRRWHGLPQAAIIVAVLAAVWAMNFLLLLPAINPGFVHIVPMPVSFVSKLLFGLAAAWAVTRGGRNA